MKGVGGSKLEVGITFETMPSVLFDAVVVLGGKDAVTRLTVLGHSLEFIKDQYRHCKPILAMGPGADLLESAGVPLSLPSGNPDEGLLVEKEGAAEHVLPAFIRAIGQHRHFDRERDPPEV